MTKLNKFRCSSGSCQATRVRFHWSYIFTKNISYWKVRQLASEIVVALSERNSISHVLYLENSPFRIEKLMM